MFMCTQETGLLRETRLRQEIREHVTMHCSNLVTLKPAFTCSCSGVRFLLHYLSYIFKAMLTYFSLFHLSVSLTFSQTGMHCPPPLALLLSVILSLQKPHYKFG